jgi:hypothetical protein
MEQLLSTVDVVQASSLSVPLGPSVETPPDDGLPQLPSFDCAFHVPQLLSGSVPIPQLASDGPPSQLLPQLLSDTPSPHADAIRGAPITHPTTVTDKTVLPTFRIKVRLDVLSLFELVIWRHFFFFLKIRITVSMIKIIPEAIQVILTQLIDCGFRLI